MRSCISGSGSVFAISGSSEIKTSSGTRNPAALAISPAITSAIRAFVPWPAPRNLSTYMPSSSASTIAGSHSPSRSGVTYLAAFTVLICLCSLRLRPWRDGDSIEQSGNVFKRLEPDRFHAHCFEEGAIVSIGLAQHVVECFSELRRIFLFGIAKDRSPIARAVRDVVDGRELFV